MVAQAGYLTNLVSCREFSKSNKFGCSGFGQVFRQIQPITWAETRDWWDGKIAEFMSDVSMIWIVNFEMKSWKKQPLGITSQLQRFSTPTTSNASALECGAQQLTSLQQRTRLLKSRHEARHASDVWAASFSSYQENFLMQLKSYASNFRSWKSKHLEFGFDL